MNQCCVQLCTSSSQAIEAADGYHVVEPLRWKVNLSLWIKRYLIYRYITPSPSVVEVKSSRLCAVSVSRLLGKVTNCTNHSLMNLFFNQN